MCTSGKRPFPLLMGYGPLFFIDPLQTYRTKGADGGTWEGRTTSMDSRGTWEMVVHSHTLCRPKPAMSTLSPLSYFPTSYGAFSFTVISQKVTIKSSSLAYALLLKKSHFYWCVYCKQPQECCFSCSMGCSCLLWWHCLYCLCAQRIQPGFQEFFPAPVALFHITCPCPSVASLK